MKYMFEVKPIYSNLGPKYCKIKCIPSVRGYEPRSLIHESKYILNKGYVYKQNLSYIFVVAVNTYLSIELWTKETRNPA